MFCRAWENGTGGGQNFWFSSIEKLILYFCVVHSVVWNVSLFFVIRNVQLETRLSNIIVFWFFSSSRYFIVRNEYSQRTDSERFKQIPSQTS